MCVVTCVSGLTLMTDDVCSDMCIRVYIDDR